MIMQSEHPTLRPSRLWSAAKKSRVELVASLVAAGDDVTDFWRGIGFRPPVAARVPSQWIETLQRRFTESTVLCYALDGEAGGADACERAVQASIERMGHREAGRAAKRHRR